MKFDASICHFYSQEKNTRIKVKVFLIILGLFVMGCSTTGLRSLPVDSNLKGKESTLTERAEKEEALLEASGFLYEDRDLEGYLNDVVDRLYSPSIKEQAAPTVKVIKDPYLDAFVFPNGRIYIHTGILARLDNEAQLAFLLAHEVIHYTHRHAFRAFGGFNQEQNGSESQRPGSSPMGRVGELLSRLGTSFTMAVMTGYSQALETEADLDGMALVSKAGYDTSEAIRFFEHLKQELDTENLKESLFFGIHPRISKRIEDCETYLERNRQTGNKGLLNKEVFLGKIRKVLLFNAFLDLKAGRYETARLGAEKYLGLKNDDARVYYLLGEILRQQSATMEVKNMKGFYEKAISIDPIYPEPYRAIGLIYYKEEDWGLARKAFESYLSLSPPIQDRAYIIGYLKQCQLVKQDQVSGGVN
jgi:beta-barrel assembly-enhancing protease